MMQNRATDVAALRTLVLAAPLMVAAADHPFTDDDWAGSSPASIPMATSNHDWYPSRVVSDPQGYLYLEGGFNAVGYAPAHNRARWDGQQWSPVDQVPTAFAKAGNELCAAVSSQVLRWDGLKMPLGESFDNNVLALVSSATDLYAGGVFTAAGGVSVNHVARWDGVDWTPVGGGLDGTVSSLAMIGEVLYAGGYFTSAEGGSANHIAKWDGSKWLPLGDGVDGTVEVMAVAGSWTLALIRLNVVRELLALHQSETIRFFLDLAALTIALFGILTALSVIPEFKVIDFYFSWNSVVVLVGMKIKV